MRRFSVQGLRVARVMNCSRRLAKLWTSLLVRRKPLRMLLQQVGEAKIWARRWEATEQYIPAWVLFCLSVPNLFYHADAGVIRRPLVFLPPRTTRHAHVNAHDASQRKSGKSVAMITTRRAESFLEDRPPRTDSDTVRALRGEREPPTGQPCPRGARSPGTGVAEHCGRGARNAQHACTQGRAWPDAGCPAISCRRAGSHAPSLAVFPARTPGRTNSIRPASLLPAGRARVRPALISPQLRTAGATRPPVLRAPLCCPRTVVRGARAPTAGRARAAMQLRHDDTAARCARQRARRRRRCSALFCSIFPHTQDTGGPPAADARRQAWPGAGGACSQRCTVPSTPAAAAAHARAHAVCGAIQIVRAAHVSGAPRRTECYACCSAARFLSSSHVPATAQRRTIRACRNAARGRGVGPCGWRGSRAARARGPSTHAPSHTNVPVGGGASRVQRPPWRYASPAPCGRTAGTGREPSVPPRPADPAGLRAPGG